MKKLFIVCLSFAFMSVFILGGAVSIFSQDTKSKEKLKFLVISETKENYYLLTPEYREKISNETTERVKKAMEDGNILELYSVPGWNRNVSIEQYESIEALYSHFAEDPSYPYIKFEIYPLQDGGSETSKPDTEKMKFLVINEAKDVWHAMGEDERKKIEDANPTKVTDFVEYWSVPGWNRSVSIEQYDDIEALYNHFDKDTYFPYGNFEVYPLFKINLTK